MTPERLRSAPRSPALALVGRETDLEAVRALVGDPETRLVTLTGVGGVGKTRLARVLAEDDEAFPDGTVFVPLAPIHDAGHVVSAVGRALGIREEGDRPLVDAILGELAELDMLLVLDNFEHVLDAALVVADLLDRCPSVTVLVTSRIPLHLAGEREYLVEPLAVPLPGRPHTPEDLAGVPALALFLARARMVSPGFALTSDNARDLAAICARLDGVPLALQLAAAGLKLMSPAQLAERLSSPLDVLVGGPRDTPERQQTLRQTLEWSHGLLESGQRRLLARLSVFAGGCTVQAAEAIGSLGAPPGSSVLSDLLTLMDHSLIRRREGPTGARLGMLQTIRAFAAERLHESGEEAAVRTAHADLFLTLAEEAAPAFRFDGDEAILDRVETEHDNLRAALRWCLDSGDSARAIRLAATLARFWLVRGHLSEGRGWLDAVLALDPATTPPGPRARALWGAGTLAHFQNDYALAADRLTESLALARAVGDHEAVAHALTGLATTVGRHHDPAGARGMFDEALRIAADLGDRPLEASVRLGLATVLWYRGEPETARPMLRESLAQAEAHGLVYEAAGARQILGWLALGDGEPEEARRLLEGALPALAALRDRWGAARCRMGLGYTALAAGDRAASRAHFAECLRIVGELGHKLITCGCLGGLGIAAVADGRPERGARLLGAAAALRRSIGANHSALVQDAQDRGLASAREALGDHATRSIVESAATLGLDAARALAEREAGEGDEGAAVGGLTLAELRVLRLVAGGLTNSQVAGELVVSERTVHAHLRAIYRKLNVGSRTAATLFAVENGLVSSAAESGG